MTNTLYPATRNTECPACGDNTIRTHIITTHANDAPSGRLTLHDVKVRYDAVCGECDEPIHSFTEDEVAAILANAAVPATGKEDQWAVLQLAHPGVRDYKPDCEECLAQVQSAIIQARATGSRGATFVTRGPGGKHSATVARVNHGIVTL